MTSRELALKIAKLADDKKARNIRILKMEGLTIVTDYFVIASASNSILVKAIADNIDDELSNDKIYPLHKEGLGEGRWVLLDYGDVVAHIFLEDEREFYNLEGLWADAPQEVFGGED